MAEERLPMMLKHKKYKEEVLISIRRKKYQARSSQIHKQFNNSMIQNKESY